MKGSIRKRGSGWSYRVDLGRENGIIQTKYSLSIGEFKEALLFCYLKLRRKKRCMKKNYKMLADAIVIQAAKDYRRAKTSASIAEIKRFFSFRVVQRLNRYEWIQDIKSIRTREILKQLW